MFKLVWTLCRPLSLSTLALLEEGLRGPASVAGLERSAHVLEKGGKVFSATLGLVDIVKGTNSYYKLQLLEDDKGSRCVLGRGVRGAVLQQRVGPLCCAVRLSTRVPSVPGPSVPSQRAWGVVRLSVREEGRPLP